MAPSESAHSPSPPPRRERVAWMQDVSRYFDRPRFVRALSEVSFEVRRGEVFGFLGPSGSGKSTILRILAGRLSPSEGKARVFGRPPQRHSARLRVGYLPQRPGHNKSRLLAQALDFLRDLFNWRPRPAASEPADVLPGNERGALLKQVLVKNPDLLLLDEPFAGLDPAACAAMTALIADWARRGKTVILTSDSLTSAKDVCDRLALCYAGRIESLGALDEILATADAIRATGPVLPPETAQRVLSALRHGLGRPDAAEPSLPGPQGGSPDAPPPAATQPAPAEEILAPLVGNARPAPAPELRPPLPSPVNNDKLAALTRPAPEKLP